MKSSKIQWGRFSSHGINHELRTKITWVYDLIWVASTFAVAVDEIDAQYAGAQDAKAHQESDTSMHTDVDTSADVNTFLSIR